MSRANLSLPAHQDDAWGGITIRGRESRLVDLTGDDLPTLFSDADRTSLEGQHQYTRATALRLWAVVLAAAAALSSESIVKGRLEVFGLVSASCFVIALAVEVWLMADRPERDWYGGRALAESAKTLAWRYSVGGAPFSVTDAGAGQRLREELAALLDDTPEINIVPHRTEAAIFTQCDVQAPRSLARGAPVDIHTLTHP